MLKRSLRDARTTVRGGFTLIELLAVIIVISILVAMLVPAVMGGFKKVRIASVVTEISQLESAIGKFRANYGMDPPSSIVLYEASGGWSNDPANVALVRQLWPRFDFSYSQAVSPGNLDINGNGSSTDVITLAGSECLVFFLGGPMTPNPAGTLAMNQRSCLGFSKNPAYPFETTSTSRDKPAYEFLPARFRDLNNNGSPEYLDPLPAQTMPYLYYSSYDGQGYNTSTSLAVQWSMLEFPYIASQAYGGVPNSGGLTNSVYINGITNSSPYWKPNSFQIISPGYDHVYGAGGYYVTTGSDRLPIIIGGPPRNFEADNITNFSGGELQP